MTQTTSSKIMSSLIILLLCSACAREIPIQVTTAAPTARTTTTNAPLPSSGDPRLSARVADLELAALQLRSQQMAMGQSLTWIEGQIKALHQALPADEAPPPTAAPSSVAPVAGKTDDKDEVAALSDADFDIQPTSPALPSSAGGGKTYGAHLASYREATQATKGIAELQKKHSLLLSGMNAHQVPFTDSQGRQWIRLNFGDFPSHEAAQNLCHALKAAGSWCDVQAN